MTTTRSTAFAGGPTTSPAPGDPTTGVARLKAGLAAFALVGLLLAVFAGSAQATVEATATCGSVTFNWHSFGSSGSANGGLNTPGWNVVFHPTGGSTFTTSGTASFAGSSLSLPVAIPRGNGVVTASTSWSKAETRDGASSNSYSKDFTISGCSASPAISTTASPGVEAGAQIHDAAVLTGGNSPTGTITFVLYAASDTTCSTALETVTAPVDGNGSYDSPSVTPASPGSYQWVATYGGDTNNSSISGTCNDPPEQVTVAAAPAPSTPPTTPPAENPRVVVKEACIASRPVLTGVVRRVSNRLLAQVTARGAKRVTFYLDGRRLVSLTKSTNGRFSVSIIAKRLSYGAHRVRATVTMSNANCANGAVLGTFIHARPATMRPKFAG